MNIAQALFLAVWTALWITIALITSLASSEAPLWLARHVWAPPLLWGTFSRYHRVGDCALDPDQPYVFVMNHQSMVDIPIAFAFIPMNIRFLFKRILYWVPFLGWFVWRTKMIAIDRSNAESAYRSIEKAARQIRDGTSIIAYPEGTRSYDGSILKFKRGVFALAQKAGVPIVPVVHVGTASVLPRDGFRIRPGTVHFTIGAPIDTAAYTDSNDDVSRLRDDVRDAIVELHERLSKHAEASQVRGTQTTA